MAEWILDIFWMESLKAQHISDEESLAQPETQLQSVQRVNMQFRIFLDLIIKTLPQQSHMINLNILKQPM